MKRSRTTFERRRSTTSSRKPKLSTNKPNEWFGDCTYVCRIRGNTHTSFFVGRRRRLICWHVGFFFILPPTFYYHKSVDVLFGVNMTWSDSPIKHWASRRWPKLWMTDTCTVCLINNPKFRFYFHDRLVCDESLGPWWMRWSSSVGKSKKNKRKMPLLAYGSWRAIHLSLFFPNENIHYAITSSLLLGRHIWEEKKKKKQKKESFFLLFGCLISSIHHWRLRESEWSACWLLPQLQREWWTPVSGAPLLPAPFICRWAVVCSRPSAISRVRISRNKKVLLIVP